MAAEGIDPAVFQRLVPSQFISFSFPNPLRWPQTPYADTLRVAVLDSASLSPPMIAAIVVPHRREDDWLFSTHAGHLQLLHSFTPSLPVSRLVLVGDLPSSPSSLPRPYSRHQPDDPSSLDGFKQSLLPLLLVLCPKSAFSDGFPSITFLSYEDDIIRSTPVEKLAGPSVGEMLIEDVEIDLSPAGPELRRRLRFKRMPNLVQTQVRLLPKSVPEVGSMVQPYLKPMVAALSLNAPAIEVAVDSGSPPTALCIGVGGGPLLMSLRSHLGFRVVGVEGDAAVLRVAHRHFGLLEDEFLKVIVGDGIKLFENYTRERSKRDRFHAVMVDLDEQDPMKEITAPPAEFLRPNVLLGARLALQKQGILVVNVIPSAEGYFLKVVELFREVFGELYEVGEGDGVNRVLIAATSPLRSVSEEKKKKEGPLYEKLKQLDCDRFIDAIRKI
ncbi:hypothetical protein AXF42_Ash009513 [Apostasia shenzhenica]|uniref:Methyltransferase-like protein 13 n=1 Tax=Apostasia shenzhenica TaxID=1088818 RepID=A0A2I0B927_9ASPA|nr:hypothetical protein AXF42_Ash009513 [Apostasia shenzhenica]